MEVKKISVKKIKVKRNQARQEFNEEKLINLAESIQEVGQLQPVIVKKEGSDFLLVAGERRLRAIKKNKEEEISAVIMEDDIEQGFLRQIQLVENIQRQDLNPLERAIGIQKLIDENGFSKKDASIKLGIPRTTLTEWLNILDVKEKYRQEVLDEDSPLSLSHISLAKGLSSRTGDPTKQNRLLDGVIKYKLSRDETKGVVDIIYKYLHIPMEEAFNAVLLKRGHQKIIKQNQKEIKIDDSGNPAKTLLSSFINLGNRVEVLLDKVDYLDDNYKQKFLEEFLYIYQMLGIMVPELKDDKMDKLIMMIRGN